MIEKTLNRIKSWDAIPLVASIIALFFFGMLHIKGIGIGPDSWAFWQGAGSLLEGRGYTYFSGAPILWWPPLYSVYLAGWSYIFGLNGLALILGNGALVALQTWLWCKVIFFIWKDSGGGNARLACFSAAIFIGSFVARYNQSVLAYTLQLTFLPILVLATWQINRGNGFARLSVWTAVAVLSASGAMLSHHSSIAFVGASVILVVAKQFGNLEKVGFATVIGGLPLLVWFAVRGMLGQGGSHTFGVGIQLYTPVEYLVQGLHGIGGLLVPDRFGGPFVVLIGGAYLVVLLSRDRPNKRALSFVVAFAAVSFLGFYTLFNLFWVHNSLSGGYLLFVPLLTVPLLLLAGTRGEISVAIFRCVVLIVLLPQFYWLIKWTIINGNNRQEGFVTADTWISPQYLHGPPVKLANGVLIPPWAAGNCSLQPLECLKPGSRPSLHSPAR